MWLKTQEQYEMQASSLRNILWGCGFSSSLKSVFLSFASVSSSTWEQTDYRVPIPVVSGQGKNVCLYFGNCSKDFFVPQWRWWATYRLWTEIFYFKQLSLKLTQMLIYQPLTIKEHQGSPHKPWDDSADTFENLNVMNNIDIVLGCAVGVQALRY